MISLKNNKPIQCVTYQKYNENEVLDKPSPAYKNIILHGAFDLKLPIEYIKFLKSFEDNGYAGEIKADLPASLLLDPLRGICQQS